MDKGRPVRTLDSANRNAEIERLLVEGELVTDTEGKEVRIYPTSSEVADRSGVSKSWVSKYAKANRCFERRADLQSQVEAKAREELARKEGKRLAYNTEQMLQAIDKALAQYEHLIENRGINNFTANDFDKLVRLRRFLEGDPDSRQEVTNTITLEHLQQRHRDSLRDLHQASDEECGIETTEVPENPRTSPFEDVAAGSENQPDAGPKTGDANVH